MDVSYHCLGLTTILTSWQSSCEWKSKSHGPVVVRLINPLYLFWDVSVSLCEIGFTDGIVLQSCRFAQRVQIYKNTFCNNFTCIHSEELNLKHVCLTTLEPYLLNNLSTAIYHKCHRPFKMAYDFFFKFDITSLNNKNAPFQSAP